MPSVFFSYSHKDEDLRNELEIHLAPLKREGLITTWHDRCIPAGDNFERSISSNLDSADIVLLLVSPYFLASDYCNDIEMTRAMQRHNEGTTRVIPVILHPCDWKTSPFGELLATPKDGKPVSKHTSLHDAFLDIVTSIRQAISETGVKATTSPQPPAAQRSPGGRPHPRSSNLRVPTRFTDYERDQFRVATFEYIANYFENSLLELDQRNQHLDCSFRRIDANTFTAAAYVEGESKSTCKIMMHTHFGDIAYSHDDRPGRNGCNAWMSIHHDGHIPTLQPNGGGYSHSREERGLTQEGAAEHFWAMFMEPLQRQ